MSRISRIVPTAVLTVAALALVAPAAQAKPTTAPSGGPNSTSVSPIAASSQAAHRNSVPKVTTVVVTTGDTPLANPVEGSDTLGVGLLHASTVPSHSDSQRPVSVPATPSNGFDWTSAAIGAGLVGILMLMVAGGVGFRRRGQLAA
ncbi:MAG: hypothetical protein ACRDQE_07680 [Gaiellales bacterium]